MRTTTHLLMTIAIVAAAALPGAEAVAQNYSGHTLTICQNGDLRTFGRNATCQLGLGATGGPETTPQVPGVVNVVSVAIGNEHSLALNSEGTVYAWGNNYQGCAAQDPSTYSMVCDPTAVALPGCAVAIAAGTAFSLALLTDGTVWAWGYDNVGQLGDASGNSSTYIPVQVAGITTAKAIAAGGEFGLALLSNGKMKSWGVNGSGELGDNTTMTAFTPVTVKTATGDLNHVIDIAAGSNHSVVLKDNGQVWVWGANGDGQLCQGNNNNSSVAIQASGLYSSITTEIDVAACAGSTMVLNSNGTTRVCGSNDSKQLGITGAGPFNTAQGGPTIANAIDIHMVSTGRHGWAVTSGGDLYSWGLNLFGQLGDGTTANQAPPVLINDPYADNTCPAKASEDNHPQPCCVAVRDYERIQLNNATINSSTTYTGQYISISGTLTINAPYSLTLSGCDVVLWPDAKIIVSAGTTTSNGATLSISNASHLYACDKMWDRIEVRNGARLYVQGSSIIEDAEVAADLTDGCLWQIDQATFNRNYTHIKLTGPTTGPVFGANYRVTRSHFGCQTTASLGGTAVYTNLLTPRENQITGVAIQATGSRRCQIGAAGNANTFNNAGYGIIAQTVKLVDLLYNTMNDIGQVGVYVFGGQVSTGQNNTIDVKYNNLYKMPYGIFVYDNEFRARTHIIDNLIDFAGMTSPPTTMVGITVQEVTPAPSGQFNYVDVSDNRVWNAPCGIEMINLRGNLVGGGVATCIVNNNKITHAKDVSYVNGAGIKTSNVSETAITENEVWSPTSAINWWENAIRISGGSHLSVSCNNLHEMGKGIFTDNDIRPDSKFYINDLENHDAGFFINFSKIGYQATDNSPGTHNPSVDDAFDNRWNGSWTGRNHIETYGITSDGLLSAFTVRTGAPFYPSNIAWSNGASAVPIYTTTNPWAHGCEFVAPNFKVEEGAPAANTDAGDIANAATDGLSDRELGVLWNGQYGLYKKLLIDPAAAETDEVVAAFFTEADQGNMGRLHRILSAYADGESIDLLIETSAELDHIEPINRPEATLKEVLHVLLNADGSAEQTETLRQAAQRCPLDDGFGVYMARAALIGIEGIVKPYSNECELSPMPEGMDKGRPSGVTEFISLFPNPAADQLFIDQVLAVGDIASISVLDPTGRVVLSQPVATSGIVAVDISDLNPGLFLLNYRTVLGASQSVPFTKIK